MTVTKEIGIRFRTVEGQENVWWVPRSSLRDDSDAGLKTFLLHWHPDYTFLGQATREAAAAVVTTKGQTQ